MVGILVPADFGRIRPSFQQTQVDHFILRVLVRFNRQGRSVGRWDGNRCPIRKNRLAFLNLDFAQAQRFLVYPQFFDSPGVGPHGPAPVLNEGLEITVVLLEMLRPQEHALRPDYF